MNNAASQYGIVDLNNVKQNNVVYIDLGKPQRESIFERQYKMAAKCIADIISKSDAALYPGNDVCSRCPRNSCDACMHRLARERQNGNRQSMTEFHTAVPIIGDRGTGKTSVMHSVLERLRNYNGNDPNAPFYLGDDYKQVGFITMDMVDCGMMKKTEDVLEIILAQMLGYLENLHEDNEFLELYRQIDELHKDLCHLGEDDDRKPEEFGLTSLQHVADSRGAVAKFQKLVKEFLAAMSQYRFNCQRCYLVIALDDVDMYQGSKWGMNNPQYALLEHIYCHLRIPGLIVLMTYNEHLLKRACNRHFEEIYFGGKKMGGYTPTEQLDIEGLTGQFMSKLFPQEKRIYMPNYMLVDALNRSNLYVRPSLDNKQLHPFGADEKMLPVKEFMLRLIAYKTDVYFDAAGTKKHFFEPRNLRELGELFQFVNSMADIPEKGDSKELIRAQNRRVLLDYLKNQFALRHLDAEEYKEFSDLLTLPLYRQDRTLIDKIRLQRQKIAMNRDDFGHLSGAKEDRWRYSYGELLHNIYFSTRISKTPGGNEPYLRKEFMRCIFGTHSVQLNEAVRSARSRQEMLKVVGSSLAGRWANKMMPKMSLVGYEDLSSVGSISLPVRCFFNWQIPEWVEKAIFGIGRGEIEAEKAVFQFVEALVVTGMFFTNVPSRGLGIRLDAGAGEDGKAVLFLRSDSNEQICFNVLNFAINLYNALSDNKERKPGYLDAVETKLLTLGEAFVARLKVDWKKEQDNASDTVKKLNENGKIADNIFAAPDIIERTRRKLAMAENENEYAKLWLQFQWHWHADPEVFLYIWNNIVRAVVNKYRESVMQWQANHGQHSWVLPVQNFDMMYNINKRLANLSYYDIPDDANASAAFEYCNCLYQNLAEELEKQDDVYFKEQSRKFSAAFKECAFYTAMTASDEHADGSLNEDYNPYIEEILVAMISTTIRPNATRKREAEISVMGL